MSFAAEPYGVFVDDLVSALTGGVVREDFAFVPESAPYKLGLGFQPGTVRIQGLAGGTFFRFRDGTDFAVTADGTVTWLASGPGTPAAGATWPDDGTHFYASYERPPDAQAPPLLTDRNPGSVVRTLAESFAREYAVLSTPRKGAISTRSWRSSASSGGAGRSPRARSSSRARRPPRPTSSFRRARSSRPERCRR
jgi:hypothetical protein